MTRCIIHFGMPKTGSSSIQTYLIRSLNDPRFHCLHLGQRGSGNIIASSFMRHPEQQHRNYRRGIGEAQLQGEVQSAQTALREQLASACREQKITILSAEILASIEKPALAALFDCVREYIPHIHAVGYIRKPLSFMESVFQQRLKSGIGNFVVSENYPRYRARFTRFEALLGAANLEFWPFEPATFPNGCGVQDFCQRVGITHAGNSIRRVNDSLSLPAIQLLYAYRKFGPGYGVGEAAIEENRSLIRRLHTLAGPRLRFHAALVAPVLEQNRPDIHWMEQRLDSSLMEQASEAADAIRSEADLLDAPGMAREWLAQQLGKPSCIAGTAQELAAQMHQLRHQHPRDTSTAKRSSPVRRWLQSKLRLR